MGRLSAAVVWHVEPAHEPFWGDPSIFEGSAGPSIPEGQGRSLPGRLFVNKSKDGRSPKCRSKDGPPLKNPTTAADRGRPLSPAVVVNVSVRQRPTAAEIFTTAADSGRNFHDSGRQRPKFPRQRPTAAGHPGDGQQQCGGGTT
jgi:hypothetical protein